LFVCLGLIIVLFCIGMTPASRLWPVEITLAAETDSTVRVTWHRDDEHRGCGGPKAHPTPYDSFELCFRAIGSSTWTPAVRTTDTSALHDPAGRTGDYNVRGWRSGVESWSEWAAASTVPCHHLPTDVFDFGSDPNSGYSFNSGALVMDAPLPGVALYVTDFRPGRQGPYLWLASPDLVPYDTGGTAPAGNWNPTWFTGPLADPNAPLPSWDIGTWPKRESIPCVPLWFGCRTADDHYAVVRVSFASIGYGRVTLESWYQAVPGLRLVCHAAPDHSRLSADTLAF
jgi:hypothetical protein